MAMALVCSVAPAQAPERRSSGVPNLQQRLAALSPENPMDYFNLAEEIGYEMPMGVARELAQRLFALSAALDRRSASPEGLTHSVCIALAELATDADERRWLRSLAEAVREDGGRPSWRLRGEARQTDDTPEQFARAMGSFRGGDGATMRALMRRVDGEALLRDAGLDHESASGVMRDLQRLVPLMRPLGPGRDGRVVRSTRDGVQTVEIDPETGGNPGPGLTSSEFVDHLRAELVLLGAQPSTWSAQLMLDRGRVYRDLDPEALGAYFRIDVERSVWRLGGASPDWTGGSWVIP
ncbi:MAG: hypothetical protein EA380_06670 [Phycisphaeraceae bacterium]|nr:MAG: hypothetical protein EA380_06670 [Phycisphaeraceae bacterium]